MILTVAGWIGALGTIGGAFAAVFVLMKKLADGQRCQLRSEMLKIYYRNCETETIHQYEYENFSMLHDAYKALRGNSFIDKIWKEIQGWEIVTRREELK